MGLSCMSQETQTEALYQPRGVGCGGEGEIYGKSNMETYITICKIDIQ